MNRRHSSFTALSLFLAVATAACEGERINAPRGNAQYSANGSPITSSSAEGQLSACVNNASGLMKMLFAAQPCAPSETLVAWNQQGPAGPMGPPGSGGSVPTTAVYSVEASGSSARVFCPTGETPIAGGAYSTDASIPLVQNFPIDETGANASGASFKGWQGSTLNWEGTVQVFVVCVQ